MRAYMARMRAEKKARADAVLLAETPLVVPPPKKKDWGRIIAPAPDDDCHRCGHDRHSSQHVYGVCQAVVVRGKRCLCDDYDLGFE